jgi:hypothetical protein
VHEKKVRWVPASSKQWLAFFSKADELFFGGSAGGGKSDLIIGMAAECHQHSVIFRRVYPNLKEIIRRSRQVIGESAKENKADKIWNWKDGRTLEFGAVQHEDSKTDWQGRPHDLKAFDELPEFTESQYLFITGWNRTTDKGQRTRVIATGNPPIDEAGSWVTKRWAPWVDPNHHNPAKSGELRWYATMKGKEIECENGNPISYYNDAIRKMETIYPRSRTFIQSLLEDNPYYAQDHRYVSVLQSLPEPIRSMLLYGDFNAAAKPDPFQVISADHVRRAQRRWMEHVQGDGEPQPPKGVKLTAVGIDPSRGGDDKTSLSKRYDNWFDSVTSWPGVVVKDGAILAELARKEIGNTNPLYINIDIGGTAGGSAYDHLKVLYNNVVPFNGAEGSEFRDKSGRLKMRNKRAEMYWRFKEALDPLEGDDLMLPNDPRVLADLCAAKYKVSSAGVQIEDKGDIHKRIGRSPDEGESILYCHIQPDILNWENTENLGSLDDFKKPWD